MNFGRESEILEFKKSTSEIKEAMEDISAILNKHGQGDILFGVKPNGDVCGQIIGFSTLDDIARNIKQSIKPMIYPKIEEKVIDNISYIKVSFSGTERPYSSNGRYFLRVVDRSEEMTPDQLKSIMSSTDYTSKWENNLTKFTINDIDKNSLERFYKKAVSCGRLDELLNYNEKELLAGLGLMENDKLTNAGFFLFSNKKPVVLKIATYLTDERINFSDIRRIEDNVFNLIEIGYKYIIEKMNWHVETSNNTSRIEIPEIPVDAIREILVNSFAHADYRGITENEINITPTQIEIYNPGEFPLNLVPEDFVNNKRKSQPRNKVILNTLFKSKDVEIFGSGFKKVYVLCKNNNIELSYTCTTDGFSFVFKRKNDTINVTKNVTINKNLKLSKTEINILNLLKESSSYSREDISKKLNITTRTVQRAINNLEYNNLIIRVGSKKKGYWEIIDKN